MQNDSTREQRGRSMMRKRIIAAAAASTLAFTGLGFTSATEAQAAIWGCSVREQSKVSNGVTQYRVVADCYGTPPKGITYYRAKGLFSVLGTGQGDIAKYGPWVKASSGTPSYTAWVAWPYRTNDQGRLLQTK